MYILVRSILAGSEPSCQGTEMKKMTDYQKDNVNKIAHTKTKGSTLEFLTEMANTTGRAARNRYTAEIHVDARGFTYKSVRACDMDRLSDK